ncbi:type IV conjugative transfer system protein TraL [Vibrio cholerae]|nr:type IV conjugative transfer system protein TraL [Vibrio cholerae]
MSEKPVDMPDLVDEQIHFLIWQLDEIATIAIGLVVGIIINSPALGLMLGYVAKIFYIRIRDGKPRGYFVHRMREAGLAIEKQERYSSMQPPLVHEWR